MQCCMDKVSPLGRSTQPILIGDENPALLRIKEISPPAHTHYQGVVSNQEDFSHLVCGQKKDNGSVIVVCDLGNPIEAGHQVRLKAGLYFSMGGLEQVENHITFQMQIRSKNSQNPDSNLVQLQVKVNAVASLEMCGVSSPVDCVLSIAKWEPKDYPEDLDEVGPLVDHVYELRNMGPSPVNAKLTLEFPVSQNESYLLYVFANASEELISCQTDYSNIDPRGNCSSGEQCLRFEREAVGLQRDERAKVRVMSRLWVQTFLKRPYVNFVLHSTAHYEVADVPSKIKPEVLPRGKAETHTNIVWRRPDGQEEVPVWWIVVSVIAGLLLLTALSTIFWKVGFFKRNHPPCDDDGDDMQQLSGEPNEIS